VIEIWFGIVSFMFDKTTGKATKADRLKEQIIIQ